MKNVRFFCNPRYLVHNFDAHRGMDEEELLEALPHRLRQDVKYYLNRDLIVSLPLMHGTYPREYVYITKSPQFAPDFGSKFTHIFPGVGMDDRIVLAVSDRLTRKNLLIYQAPACLTEMLTIIAAVQVRSACRGIVWCDFNRRILISYQRILIC